MSAPGRRAGQALAPYLDALVAHGFRGPGRFHVPGHKGGEGADPGLRAALGDSALQLDIPADMEGIDLGPEPTPFARAEELAARAYGAAQTWFLVNGATQGNHALCLALAPLGAAVVVQRNCHASVIDGLVLSGGSPSFVHPEIDTALGMAHGVTPAALDAALASAPAARAAFVVSPTYYGMAADVAGLAEAAHGRGAALVVDQAWGAHFGFHPDVPLSALDQGADAVLTSTHKIVGSLTQSALLHVGGSGLVDAGRLARAVRLTRSTSPSALLMASLDAARRQLATHGEALLERTLEAVAATRARIAQAPGCALLGDELVGTAGIVALDPLRIVVDVRETGLTGYELALALRTESDVHVELATQATIVLVIGIAEPVDALERFAHDFVETVRELGSGGPPVAAVPVPPAAGEPAVSPRDAFLGEAETVAVGAAEGRVSAETIAGYPPGIPALLPGERITAAVIAHLEGLVAAGARLHGASDPHFRTITVLAGS